MATTITSISQLRKTLEQKAQQALILTQEEIYEVIQHHLSGFYEEPAFGGFDPTEPSYYVRTYQFLNNLIKTNIVQTGNGFSCSVGFDEDYLKYKYPGNPKWTGNVPATGLDVVTWANESSHDYTHGYTVGGFHSFWDDAMKELGGKQGILNIMKRNLKRVGIPVA